MPPWNSQLWIWIGIIDWGTVLRFQAILEQKKDPKLGS